MSNSNQNHCPELQGLMIAKASSAQWSILAILVILGSPGREAHCQDRQNPWIDW
jgi:hypothetical protein